MPPPRGLDRNPYDFEFDEEFFVEGTAFPDDEVRSPAEDDFNFGANTAPGGGGSGGAGLADSPSDPDAPQTVTVVAPRQPAPPTAIDAIRDAIFGFGNYLAGMFTGAAPAPKRAPPRRRPPPRRSPPKKPPARPPDPRRRREPVKPPPRIIPRPPPAPRPPTLPRIPGLSGILPRIFGPIAAFLTPTEMGRSDLPVAVLEREEELARQREFGQLQLQPLPVPIQSFPVETESPLQEVTVSAPRPALDLAPLAVPFLAPLGDVAALLPPSIAASPALSPSTNPFPFLRPSLAPSLSPARLQAPQPFVRPTVAPQPTSPLTPPRTTVLPLPPLGFLSPLPNLGPIPKEELDRCKCPKKKPAKKRQPRTVCYTGTYREFATGLTKIRKRKVTCQPSK